MAPSGSPARSSQSSRGPPSASSTGTVRRSSTVSTRTGWPQVGSGSMRARWLRSCAERDSTGTAPSGDGLLSGQATLPDGGGLSAGLLPPSGTLMLTPRWRSSAALASLLSPCVSSRARSRLLRRGDDLDRAEHTQGVGDLPRVADDDGGEPGRLQDAAGRPPPPPHP